MTQSLPRRDQVIINLLTALGLAVAWLLLGWGLHSYWIAFWALAIFICFIWVLSKVIPGA